MDLTIANLLELALGLAFMLDADGAAGTGRVGCHIYWNIWMSMDSWIQEREKDRSVNDDYRTAVMYFAMNYQSCWMISTGGVLLEAPQLTASRLSRWAAPIIG